MTLTAEGRLRVVTTCSAHDVPKLRDKFEHTFLLAIPRRGGRTGTAHRGIIPYFYGCPFWDSRSFSAGFLAIVCPASLQGAGTHLGRPKGVFPGCCVQ